MATAIYRNLECLIAARERYARIDVPVTFVYGDEDWSRIDVPVTFVYGDQDWSRPSDRQANIDAVPGARDIVLHDTGHFAALEAPDDVARILLRAVGVGHSFL